MNSLETETVNRKERLKLLSEYLQDTGSELKLSDILHKQAQEPTTIDPVQITIEKYVEGTVEKTLNEREKAATQEELDITAIAPRRADWDLKKELKKRLDELQDRNEAAIADLIRKRVQEGGNIGDVL
ncbi:Coiled-coil domain-containing protein 12 [Coemansia sp. RSA 1085]|nr:Coiled-coil domain-containing protein 12 [Coemansia sp. RSA 1086]KAJ2676080.1 Coiled-coil domain-containing protein 12 [Coemansia sp. RSA 1085]